MSDRGRMMGRTARASHGCGCRDCGGPEDTQGLTRAQERRAWHRQVDDEMLDEETPMNDQPELPDLLDLTDAVVTVGCADAPADLGPFDPSDSVRFSSLAWED